MIIQRTWRYRLYATPSQAAELERQLGPLCDVYNSALEQRRRMWRDHGASIGYRQQSRQLTEARGEHAWLRSMNALAQHGALKRLDRAYQAFFRRCAAGEKPGYPRFRSRRHYNSITWPQYGNGAHLGEVGERNGRVELQGVGRVKFRAHRPLAPDAKLGQVTVTRRNGRWWLTIAVELPAAERERSGDAEDPGRARVVGSTSASMSSRRSRPGSGSAVRASGAHAPGPYGAPSAGSAGASAARSAACVPCGRSPGPRSASQTRVATTPTRSPAPWPIAIR